MGFALCVSLTTLPATSGLRFRSRPLGAASVRTRGAIFGLLSSKASTVASGSSAFLRRQLTQERASRAASLRVIWILSSPTLAVDLAPAGALSSLRYSACFGSGVAPPTLVICSELRSQGVLRFFVFSNVPGVGCWSTNSAFDRALPGFPVSRGNERFLGYSTA